MSAPCSCLTDRQIDQELTHTHTYTHVQVSRCNIPLSFFKEIKTVTLGSAMFDYVIVQWPVSCSTPAPPFVPPLFVVSAASTFPPLTVLSPSLPQKQEEYCTWIHVVFLGFFVFFLTSTESTAVSIRKFKVI